MNIKAEVWSECINQVLFLCVVPPLYQGLLSISHVIHDPFGEDLLDFPVMAFQEYMNEASVVISGSGNLCPALKKPVVVKHRPAETESGSDGSKLQPGMA